MMQKKTLIVYYSLEGNTAYAAETIAAALGADLLRLIPKKAYPNSGFKKFFWGGKSADMGETPALEPYTFDASSYDTVILGFPIWASRAAPPIQTFLKDNDLREKKLAVFACQSGSGAEKAFEKLKACLGHSLEKTLILIDPKDKPDPAKEAQMEDFCDSLAGPGMLPVL